MNPLAILRRLIKGRQLSRLFLNLSVANLSHPKEASMNAAQGTMLVVDDNEMNRDMLSRRLEKQGHIVATAENGCQAIEMLRTRPFDLVLLDIMMPEMNGYEVLEKVKSDMALRQIPVIVISAVDQMESVVRCIELGAEDYLPKPFDPVLLRARVGASLERKRLYDLEENYRIQLEDRVEEQVREISSAQQGVIFAMSKLAESRDPETGAHLERIQEYCRTLSKELSKLTRYASEIDKTFIENIHAASPLHDIGKVGIPDHILKKPGGLTEEEFAIMKTHTVIGVETLRAVDRQNPGNKFVCIGVEIAGSHHERWDGTGYPHGLAGEDIPLAGRIVALADVYDALTSKRCYKEALPHEESREIILAERGKHFDHDIVDCFLSAEKEFQTVRMELADLS
jgi:putative two-component system response regulator